jgi:hypothetical protein
LYTYNKRRGKLLKINEREVSTMMTQEEERVLREKAAHDDHVRAINKRSFVRRQTWIKLMLVKAAKAGIKASDEEVLKEMARVK